MEINIKGNFGEIQDAELRLDDGEVRDMVVQHFAKLGVRIDPQSIGCTDHGEGMSLWATAKGVRVGFQSPTLTPPKQP